MDTAQDPVIQTPNIFYFWQEPPDITKNSKSSIWVERKDFYCFLEQPNPVVAGEVQKGGKKRKKASEPYLIVGFDTEFKTPPTALSRSEIKEGLAKSIILSYQFHAKHPDGREWQGICCPDGDERLTLQQFMVFVMGVGARQFGIDNLPTNIYLVGHFTRADIPAFADFADLTKYISAVRSTFVSLDTNVKQMLPGTDCEIPIKIFIRDTMLLTPQTSKSLKALGELVDVNKVELSPDRAVYKEMIRNMDSVRSENWDLFKSYALTDAEVCVRYIEQVIAQYKEITGKDKVPVTLTSIGLDQLLIEWKGMGLDKNTVLGKERVIERVFRKKLGYYINQKVDVDIDEVSRGLYRATESYHGGRNEQFWFGPGFEDAWTDFDLSSAYPTAMALIGLPDWRSLYNSTELKEFTPTTLGYALIDFEFPTQTRYPCIPVRTDGGLIFPLTGKRVSCCAPEIAVAMKLGAKITIHDGVIVPHDTSQRVFGTFIKNCLDRRISAGKKTLRGLFWKEISNSTYGKTAQGLRRKRVYDLRERGMKTLDESPITNPFFAAFITSFTRALLGEIINAIPDQKMVFSCTTDGFLSNISDAEMHDACRGDLAQIFSKERHHLTGSMVVLEKKHAIRCPLGWRTRGQATLMPGTPSNDPDEKNFHIVLAKGGIFTAPEFEEVSDQNDEILRLFFIRTPDSVIRVEAKTGIREMVEHDADLVVKYFDKRLNMEFDWKRRPTLATWSERYQHISFHTTPWYSVDQYSQMRSFWEEYTKGHPACLKTLDDFDRFTQYVETRSLIQSDAAKYMRKVDGDVVRLRQQLCAAYKQGKAGLAPKMFGFTNVEFAEFLTYIGIPCKKTDVENGKRYPFVPHVCPATEEVLFLLLNLKLHIEHLDEELFLYDQVSNEMSPIDRYNPCQFTEKVQ
jgi:hypothetical protein